MKQTVKDATFRSMTLIAGFLCRPLSEMDYVVPLVSVLAQLGQIKVKVIIDGCQNIFFWSQSSPALQFIWP